MSIHHLKINRQPFEDLVSGRKTGEVRNCSDRDFKVGDSVELFMTETESGRATESIVRTITHIQRGYGLPDDICVLSYANHSEEPLGVVEPVAWLALAIGDGGEIYRKTTASTEITLQDTKYCWGQGVIDRFKIVIKPLYTSPPAPVAVPVEVHKQLIEMRRQFERANFVSLGKLLNACLDKVKELNQ